MEVPVPVMVEGKPTNLAQGKVFSILLRSVMHALRRGFSIYVEAQLGRYEDCCDTYHQPAVGEIFLA